MQLATAIARRVRSPAALLIGPALALAALVGVVVTPLGGDVALVALAAALLGSTGLVAREVKRLGSLPLEIAPVALGGEVDARPVLRFRARLGLGRVVREATASVVHEGPSGTAELPTHVPSGALVGPFTILAFDPERRCGEGRLRVTVSAREGDRTWTAEVVVPCPAAEGRFGGVSSQGGRLVFEDDWHARQT